jgi:hypothetical protein
MRSALAFGVRASRRLSGFAISVILLAVASLVLMPATIGAAGLSTWSSIVLGQSLALIVQMVAGLGYGVNGPALVATRSLEEGVKYFLLAQRVRIIVFLPCVAIMIGTMFVVPNPNPVVGLLGSAHLAIGSFTGLFFYIGRAAPLWFLLAETGPRAVLMLAGAVSLHLRVPLVIGLSLPALGAVLGMATSTWTIYLSARRLEGKDRSDRTEAVSVWAELRSQLGPMAANLLRGGRDALPVLIVTACAGGLLGVFGVFDRVQRQVVGTLAPVVSTLQGWVPRRMVADNSARPAVLALVASFLASPLFLLVFALAGSPLIRWLSAGEVSPNLPEILWSGAFIATSVLIWVIAFACLVPLGRISNVIYGDLTGIASILIGILAATALEQSVVYILGALVIANVVQIVVQLALVRRSITGGNLPATMSA